MTAEPILKDPDATLTETDCLQLWTTAGVSIISRHADPAPEQKKLEKKKTHIRISNSSHLLSA